MEKMVRAKSAIILTICSSPIVQVSDITDDDGRTDKELWDVLINLYTTSNAQEVINVEQELEALQFEDVQNWVKHM